MIAELTTYLLVHGIITVGSVLTFFIRNEHRITKVETTVALLKEQLDRHTSLAFDLHQSHHSK